MIRTVNIRALKDKLSAFLRDVQRGDVVLVSDRGRVVAEIRQPSIGEMNRGGADHRSRALTAAGILSVGLPNSPDAYPPADVHLTAHVVAQALDETRGER
jgi:antitoxin (DNA-binding transcriptional repressor) of toxin-antitoxin stability system